MLLFRTIAIPGLSSVGRWTIFGTLACVLASLSLTWLLILDIDSALAPRILLVSTTLPILIGAPLFFFFSLKLRGLAIANKRLDRVARTDSLTACLNRRAFTARVNAWLLGPSSPPCGALLVIDADNFKSVNDVYGHESGDEALTIIARAIRSVLRVDDLVGRITAVDLLRKAVAVLGGQGGGGRPDMAQGGGPDGSKAADAVDAIRAALAEAPVAA